jgi:hypothetical protein
MFGVVFFRDDHSYSHWKIRQQLKSLRNLLTFHKAAATRDQPRICSIRRMPGLKAQAASATMTVAIRHAKPSGA